MPITDFAFARIATYSRHIAKVREWFCKEHSVLPYVIMNIICSFYELTEFEHFEQVITSNGVYANLRQHGTLVVNHELLSAIFPWKCNKMEYLMKEFDADGLQNTLYWNTTDMVAYPLFGRKIVSQWESDGMLDDKADAISAMLYKRYIRSAKALLRGGKGFPFKFEFFFDTYTNTIPRRHSISRYDFKHDSYQCGGNAYEFGRTRFRQRCSICH